MEQNTNNNGNGSATTVLVSVIIILIIGAAFYFGWYQRRAVNDGGNGLNIDVTVPTGSGQEAGPNQ
jgi:hypothetical protein